MYKFTVYIPVKDKESVKTAMFMAGAGRIGNYDCCAFEVEGFGQFKPLIGANPHVGIVDRIERVREVRVEMVVADKYIRDVVAAMKKAHPYETPAFDVIRVEDF